MGRVDEATVGELSGTIPRATTSGTVADRLRQEIQRGHLRPGTHLVQEDIASRLGVSTTPVREALQVLQGEGLVTMDPHRGVVVFRPTAEDVREYYEIRELLETFAIEVALKTPPDHAAIEEITSLVDQMESRKDNATWLELNDRFHAEVYELSGRKRLCSFIKTLVNATSGYMHLFIDRARASGQADKEHREILEAIRTGDVERAKRAVTTHIHHTVEAALSFLDELGNETPR